MIFAAVSDPNEKWVDLLANNGLAIVIIMFLMLIVCPAVGGAIIVIMRWGAKRADRVIDGHMNYMETTATAMDNLVTATVEGHAQQYAVLADVKRGVDALHQRWDAWPRPVERPIGGIITAPAPTPTPEPEQGK